MVAIVQLQGTMEQAKLSTVSRSAQPKSPPRSQTRRHADSDGTCATIRSSEGGSSVASNCSSLSRLRTVEGHDSDKVRSRYLHCLGKLSGSTATHAAADRSGTSSHHMVHKSKPIPIGGGGDTELLSSSAPELFQPKSYPKGLNSSARSLPASRAPLQRRRGMSLGAEEKIILLKRSVQYTTRLKSGPADPGQQTPIITEVPLKGGDGSDGSPPSSSNNKFFELSSAWTSLLAEGGTTASMTSTSAASEPLDGAYDLFSLPSVPSDSSVATGSRCDSMKSLDIAALDRMPSRDDLSMSSMPRQRKVSFDHTVKATTIPSRLSYSNRIRTRLWSSTEDIYTNAVRNEKEYIYDGGNWRTAREENGFVRFNSSSSSSPEELVHPVHFNGWPSTCQPYWQEEQQMAMSNRGSPSPSARNDNVNDQEFEDDAGVFEMD